MVHALLATGAVHQHLARAGLRCDVQPDRRDRHRARSAPLRLPDRLRRDRGVSVPRLPDAVRPGRARHPARPSTAKPAQIGRSYRRGINKGLLKIMSKMGICTIASYRGAQLFEIVGLDREVVDLCFAGTPSRIGGAGFARPAGRRARSWPTHAWNDNALPDIGGLLQVRARRRVPHVQPRRGAALQRAVAHRRARATGSTTPTRVNDASARGAARPAASSTRRDDADRRSTKSSRCRRSCARFDSAAMTLGALSPEAHEALAIAMNRLGGRTNSGEGGEDPGALRHRQGSARSSRSPRAASA